MRKFGKTPKEANKTQDSEGPTSGEESYHRLDDSHECQRALCKETSPRRQTNRLHLRLTQINDV